MNKTVLNVVLIIGTSFIALAYKNNIITNSLSWLIDADYVHALVTSTLYIASFRFIILLYDKYLFHIIHQNAWIGGDWVYYLRNEDKSIELYGIFQVKQGVSGISISNGSVWYCSEEPSEGNARGVWNSTMAEISNNDFSFVFDHHTLRKMEKPITKSIEDNAHILGFAELKISRKKASLCRTLTKNIQIEMSGPYYDLREMAGSKGFIYASYTPTNKTATQGKLAYEYAKTMRTQLN
ncbi:MAG TPA: hypothetical protein PKC79_04650 [Solidesulfovibrio magneticus]|nr:hypothetical protein [Solidesulfovibrio magneticus]